MKDSRSPACEGKWKTKKTCKPLTKPMVSNVKNDRLQNSLCIFAKPLQNQCAQTLCFTRVAGRWDDLWPTTFPLLHTCTTFWAALIMKVPNWRKRSKDRGKQVRQTDRLTDWLTDWLTEMNPCPGRPPLTRESSTGSNRQPLQLFGRLGGIKPSPLHSNLSTPHTAHP